MEEEQSKHIIDISKLRSAMEKSGMNAAQLAEKTGISLWKIKRLLAGFDQRKSRLGLLYKIAIALDTLASEIMHEDYIHIPTHTAATMPER